MSESFFNEKTRPPTEESIAAALGATTAAWRLLFDSIHAEHPDLTGAWNYYADGKSWLMKVTRKKKTVCWLSVQDKGFRVGFYFPERLTSQLLRSDLSHGLKTQIRNGQPTGKLRGASVVFGDKSGVQDVMTLISLKKRLK